MRENNPSLLAARLKQKSLPSRPQALISAVRSRNKMVDVTLHHPPEERVARYIKHFITNTTTYLRLQSCP